MGLGQALTSAVSGLRVTQSGLSLIASNIANAETPGYVKKTATQVAAASGDLTIGVRLSSITASSISTCSASCAWRQSGGAYATLRSDFFQRLQSVFGQPGESNALETVFNNFTSAVQALVDLARFQRIALRRAHRRADAGAAPQRHDRRHPGAAQRRRARPLRRGQPGERGAAQHRERSISSSA